MKPNLPKNLKEISDNIPHPEGIVVDNRNNIRLALIFLKPPVFCYIWYNLVPFNINNLGVVFCVPITNLVLNIDEVNI